MDATSWGTGYTGLLFWFAAILVLIPASLWLLRRTRLGGALATTGGVKVLSQSALGAGQRLVVVEVRHGQTPPQTLVLGVTPHHISLVSTLPHQPGEQVQERA